MVGPYQMVLVNLIFSLLLIGGVIFYRYIFPKKKISLPALLIIISLLPLISLLRAGDYESGDFNIHIYRTISFYQNLLDGNLMPSWAGALNGTLGYPLFIFLNPLPYYLISAFHFLGFSFITALKLFLGAAFILSGLTMYLFAKETLKHDLAAFTAAVFYLFFPYHLVDLHFRNDVGEMLCFTLIPLLLFFAYRLFKNGSFLYLFWTGLIFALIIMSHQAIALLSIALIIPFLIIQLLLNPKTLRNFLLWIKFGAAFGLGILISGYVWVPYLAYARYNLSETLFKALPSFVSLPELLYSPWRYGFLFQGPKGELSFLIGYIQIAILAFLLVYLLLKKAKAKYAGELTVWLTATAFFIFMLTAYSSAVWFTVPIIKNMLMASRVLLVLAFSVSLLAGYFVLVNKNRRILIWLVIILTIGTTILNWGHRRVIPQISDRQLINNLPYSTYQGEGLVYIGNTRWFSNQPVWINKIPVNKLEVLKGQAKIQTLSVKDTKHDYLTISNKGATLIENTLYYPGWEVAVNGRKVEIDYKNVKYPGRIIFGTPEGESKVVISYTDLPLLQSLKFLFALSLAAILSFTLLRKLRQQFF